MKRMEGAHSEPDDGSSVGDQALRWFVQLRSGHATFADRRKFHEWLAADVSRREEFEQCSRVWCELDSVKPWLRDELAQASSDWTRAEHSGARAIWRWPAAVLAALVVLVVAGGWWFATGLETAEYRTAKGERRTVILSDGSTIILNTETVVATAFSFTKRTVVLREGEALFAVSHASNRPFEVLAGDRAVRDVGTRFLIRYQSQKVNVTVVEGAVEVPRFQKKAPMQSWQILTAGEQVSYQQGGPLSPVLAVSPASMTAWVEGKVIFEARALSEVIAEMGRYQSGEIRILDPRIGALKFSGVFRVNDREGFLTALEQVAPVAVSRVNSHLVILEQKVSPLEKG